MEERMKVMIAYDGSAYADAALAPVTGAACSVEVVRPDGRG